MSRREARAIAAVPAGQLNWAASPTAPAVPETSGWLTSTPAGMPTRQPSRAGTSIEHQH